MPSGSQINASAYLVKILNHSHVTDEDKEFIKNGVKWLNEEAVTKYNTTYTKLTSSKRQETLKTISQVRWGESWIDEMLTYSLEAMISDPVYGVNKNQSGQRWLHFEAGLPSPKEALL